MMKSRVFFILVLAFFMSAAVPSSFCEEPAPAVKQRERDPMMPQEMSIFQKAKQAVVKKVENTMFQVQGVGRGPRGAYVIIDGQAYAEGETKKGITVVKIGETKVDILSDGISESLPIKKR